MNEQTGQLVQQWIRPELRELSAYHVPPATGLIKLDAMENPYVLPEELTSEWLDCLREVELNRYPDPSCGALKERLRKVMAIPEGMELLLGNGSDELILLIALALQGEDRLLLAPEPSFVMYRMIALAAGLRYHGVLLRSDDFSLDLKAMLAACEQHQPAVIFIAYPNNPTANLYPEEDLRRLIEAAPGLVVIDEAYAPFAEASFLPLLAEYPNLLVMRTVSKLGLAGLRLGLLAGDPAWIAELEKLRLPYNINVLTQASAQFLLGHYEILEGQTARIRRDREVLFTQLAEMDGIHVWPSRANFLLFRVPAGRAATIHTGLQDAGVLIKKLHGSHPALADCLRVTVGTPEENHCFIEALQPLL